MVLGKNWLLGEFFPPIVLTVDCSSGHPIAYFTVYQTFSIWFKSRDLNDQVLDLQLSQLYSFNSSLFLAATPQVRGDSQRVCQVASSAVEGSSAAIPHTQVPSDEK